MLASCSAPACAIHNPETIRKCFRMVLAPFGVSLRHSKRVGRTSGPADHTRLFVPEVHVVMASPDFQTLNDIIETIGVAEAGPLADHCFSASLSHAWEPACGRSPAAVTGAAVVANPSMHRSRILES